MAKISYTRKIAWKFYSMRNSYYDSMNILTTWKIPSSAWWWRHLHIFLSTKMYICIINLKMEAGIDKKYWNKKWWYYSEKIPTLAFIIA